MLSNKIAPKTSNQKPLSTTKPATNSTLKSTTTTTGTSSIRKPLGSTAGKKFEEEKKEAAPKTVTKTGFTEKPSSRFLNIKTDDPFAAKTNVKNNSFAYVYNAGGIPCRVDHGTAINRIKWDSNVSLEDLGFDPILITCFEGLVETNHPYSFIAKQASKELLESPGASDKVIPLLPRLITPLRMALSNANANVFEAALGTLKSLSDASGDALNEHVNGLIGALLKRMNDKKFKDNILATLHTLEENGGPSVVKIIKAKIPTYTNL